LAERREVDPNNGKPVRKDVVEDYTQHEVNDITDRFKQRPGKSLLSWMVRLHDQGAARITLDAEDSKRFLILSSHSFVQDAFWNNHQDTNLLALTDQGCHTKYRMENGWLASECPWYTLRDCIKQLKEEGMKAAVFIEDAGTMMRHPLSVTMRNKMIKTAPPAYKNVIMTLLINETGNPLCNVIEKIQQLGDLGEWDSPKGSENRISRKEMFTALLKDGMSREKIECVPTDKLWRTYKQRGLNKPSKRGQSSKPKDPGTTQPTAPS
uniref:Uncharacterized protein n=1 Tax=Otus sunia TaxID=257818 RepID=A0A8C8EDA4_9STRI